jgi:hypothetical protein
LDVDFVAQGLELTDELARMTLRIVATEEVVGAGVSVVLVSGFPTRLTVGAGGVWVLVEASLPNA